MSGKIVHDAEYYILYEQHGEKWEVEDKDLDVKLAELRNKYGAPPNIVHIMWDDMAFGDVGIPVINALRGFDIAKLQSYGPGGHHVRQDVH